MNRVRGFTLIELMIVVAILSILAAIALPAYQDYVARTQVSEAFSLASDTRTAVTVFHADRSAYPNGNLEAGLSIPASITGRYVESVTVGDGDGEIIVLLGKDASAKVHGQTLTMRIHSPGGSLHWDCGGLDPKYLPSVCR